MAEDEVEDIGKLAHHPLRTAGMAFIAGAMAGMSMVGAKKAREKSAFQKFMDRLDI